MNKVVFSLTSQGLVQWITGRNKQYNRKGETGIVSGNPSSISWTLASEGGGLVRGPEGRTENSRTGGCCLRFPSKMKILLSGVCL